MMNIYVQSIYIYLHICNILQGFQETRVAERTCTLKGPFIENSSELKLIIFSVP